MFAKVIPFRRLSRNLESFDYIAKTSSKIGDIVEIDFKGQKIKGAIEALHHTKPKFKVKKIISTQKSKAYTAAQISCIKTLAKLSFVSAGTLLYFANNKGKSKKKSDEQLIKPEFSYSREELSNLTKLINKHREIETSKRLQLALSKLIAKKYSSALIICPNQDTENELQQILSSENIIIGNRKNLLQPIYHKAIILFEASHPDYALTNQNPNFSNSFLCELYSREMNIPCFALGESLDPKEFQEVFSITKNNAKNLLKVVNMHQDRRTEWSQMLAKTTEKALVETLQSGKNVLIFANAEGSKESNFGRQIIEKQLLSEPQIKPFSNNVKVVTESGLRSEMQADYGLIIDLAFDLHQQNSLHGEHEQRFKLLRTLNTASKNSANVIIQTYSPELIDKMLSTSYHAESQSDLEKLALPPYSGLIIIQKGKDALPPAAIPVDKNKYLLYYNCETWSSLYETLKKQDHKIHHQTPKYANSCTT